MGDILLTNPIEITPPAKKVVNYSWSISSTEIIANLNYYNEKGDTILKQETFYITGNDFTPLANALVQVNHVGQKFLDIIEKAIRNKVLQLKGWSGTVS